MRRSLEMAITEVIADAKFKGRMLHVAPLAEQLAAEFNEDPHAIARRITNLGLLSRISMEIDEPPGSPITMPSRSGRAGEHGITPSTPPPPGRDSA